MYISPYCALVLVPAIFMKFGIRGHLTGVITCVKFLVDRFRGYEVLTPQNCHFPFNCCVALITVYALPCDTVMLIITMRSIFRKLCVRFFTLCKISTVILRILWRHLQMELRNV